MGSIRIQGKNASEILEDMAKNMENYEDSIAMITVSILADIDALGQYWQGSTYDNFRNDIENAVNDIKTQLTSLSAARIQVEQDAATYRYIESI